MNAFQIKVLVVALVFYLITGIAITMSVQFDRWFWKLPAWIHNSWILSLSVVLMTPLLWVLYLPFNYPFSLKTKQKK